MAKREGPSATRLREVLSYDPRTGLFSRNETGARTSQVRWDDAATKVAGGYYAAYVDGLQYYAHQLAWLYVHGVWPGPLVHINGSKEDNRIDNLRPRGVVDPGAIVTQKRVREVLAYDPETGVFTWKIGTARGRPGERAGAVSSIGYRYVAVDGRRYLAHRLAWFYVHGEWPRDQIDHINGKRDDNAISNLREATNAQNQRNSAGKINSTGFRGITKKGNRFRASITVDNRVHFLGSFKTAEEAHAAYLEARAKHHGAFVNKGGI